MDRGRPTKKIFFLFIACLVAVGSIGFATYNSKAGLKKPETLTVNDAAKNVELAQNAVRQKMEADPDMDGLMDWEEVLWETDPNKADTDGDGTKDGDEVKANRNPKIAGPNDTIASGSAGVTSSAATNDAAKKVELDNSQTGKIGRDLFASYLQAKKAGLPIKGDVQEKIIQQALQAKTLLFTAKQYSKSELTIENTIDLKNYGNSLGRAFYADAGKDTMSEINIVQSALDKNDPEEIKKLDPIISRYTQTVNLLLRTPAPQEYANIHLELLNSTNSLLSDIKGFGEIFNDPIIGLMSMGKYYQDIDRLKAAFQLMNSVFVSNRIVYGPTEYGALFSQIN